MKVTIMDVLERAHKGPVCKAKEWEVKVIPKKVSELLKKYDIRETCNRENPVNTDNDLADKFWEAGFELAVDTGVLCLTTERVIKFTEEELKTNIREAPSEMSLGEGADAITVRTRKPEDKTPVSIWFGPFGIATSEDLWIPVHQSCAQCRSIDVIIPGVLPTVYGEWVRSRTPYETLMGKYDAILTKEALRRVGRPGMPISAVAGSVSEYGQFGGYGIPGGYKSTDPFQIPMADPLKTDYSMLHRVCHAFNCGAPVFLGFGYSTIGGYAGPPEGAAVLSVASVLLQALVHQASSPGGQILDIRYLGNCGRDAIWACGVAWQGVSRNTHYMSHASLNTVSGPFTSMLLYESAAAGINSVVSGASLVCGIRSAGGKYLNRLSSLENSFAAEVCKASVGIKRSDANEILKVLLPKYEDKLRSPPIGKLFAECMDLRTLKPTQEWLNISQEVKRELIELGVPL